MYRILIVDDEAAERNVITFLLNKFEFPLQVIQAANGRDALELMSHETFDILFTDIQMPFVNGLTLAAKARELFPEMQIIFFSGYDDFEYVKEALSLRVVNYILKPVNPEEFKKTIQDVIHRLDERAISAKRLLTAREIAKNHVLYHIINKTDMDYLKRLYPLLDLSFVYDYHRLFLIQMERDYFGVSENTADEDGLTSGSGPFPEDFSGIIPEHTDFINLNPSQNVVLFSGTKHRFEWYETQARQLSEQIKKICHMDCHIAISDPFSGPEQIAQAYAQAEEILDKRFFFTNQTLYSSSSTGSEDAGTPDDNALLRQIEADIQFKDTFGLTEHLNMLLGAYQKKKSYSLIYIRFLCTSLIKILLDGFPEESPTTFDTLAQSVYSFRHFSEIETILRKLAQDLCTQLEKKQQSPKHAVSLVKQYIYTHYGEDLGLNLLAQKVYLSPRYLSTMFIEETGCGINKFIKNVRMEKARELLLNTNMRISDIGQKVGYSNVSYFCKSFMEEYGSTPEKFRQKKETT